MQKTMITIWDELMEMSKVRPYVFKTRLHRAIIQTQKYSNEKNNGKLMELCQQLEEKMRFISDQSNQTSDGELRSYPVLKEDMQKIRNEM